jgi:hypothetical protein
MRRIQSSNTVASVVGLALLSTARPDNEKFSALSRALDAGALTLAALLVTEPVLQGAMGRDE